MALGLLTGCGTSGSAAGHPPSSHTGVKADVTATTATAASPAAQAGVKPKTTASAQSRNLAGPGPTSPPPTPTYTPSSPSPSPGFDFQAAYPLPEGWSRITGTVLPQQGGLVVGATVRLVEPSGKTALTISCQKGCHFATPNLPTNSQNPPVYQLVATAPGYGTFIMQSVPLFDRQIVTVALPLPPAGQTVTDPGFSLHPGLGTDMLAPAPPTVTAISPTSGPATGGTRVTITGTDFDGVVTVDFGTRAATGITVLPNNQLQVTSPAGSGTVDVTVTTPRGPSATASADRFTYGAAPTS